MKFRKDLLPQRTTAAPAGTNTNPPLDKTGSCAAFQLEPLGGFNGEECFYFNTSFAFLVVLCYIMVEPTIGSMRLRAEE